MNQRNLRNLWITVLILPGGLLIAALGVVVAAAWAGAIYCITFRALGAILRDRWALARAKAAQRRAIAHAEWVIATWARIPITHVRERRAFLPYLDAASNALDAAHARTDAVLARIANRGSATPPLRHSETLPPPFVDGPRSVQ